MVIIDIPPEYGYVVLVGSSSCFVNIWLSMKVGMARKKFNVPYPSMYSPTSNEFNCYQRAHQNFLETYAPTLVLMFVGGTLYPKICAVGGAVWLLGRITYALGYYTGNPSNRNWGAFHILGFFSLLLCNIRLGLKLVGWF